VLESEHFIFSISQFYILGKLTQKAAGKVKTEYINGIDFTIAVARWKLSAF
jgi:hypothetical protein